MVKKKLLSVLFILCLLLTLSLICGCSLLPVPEQDEQEQEEISEPEVEVEVIFELEPGTFSYNPELEGTVVFCRKVYNEQAEQLVCVTRDGREIVLIPDTSNITVGSRSFDRLYAFDHHENRLYLCFPDSQGLPSSLAYIDLNSGDGNYDIELLPNSGGHSMTYTFLATSDSLICGIAFDWEYSLVTHSFKPTSFPDLVSNVFALQYDKKGDNLVKWIDNISLSVQNRSSGSEKRIVEGIYMLEHAYNGKVIYSNVTMFDPITTTFSEYDIKTGQTNEITGKVVLHTWGIDKDHISPYGTRGYFYDCTKGQHSTVLQLCMSFDSQEVVIAEVDCWPGMYISFLSEDKFGLMSKEELGYLAGEVLNVVVDIQTGVVSKSGVDYYYMNEVWAEGFC